MDKNPARTLSDDTGVKQKPDDNIRYLQKDFPDQEIQIERKLSSSSMTSSDSPPEMSDINHRRGTLKIGADPLIFPQKSKVLDDAPCKKKCPNNRQIPIVMDISEYLWEENPPRQPTPRRAAMESAESNTADRPSDM